MAKPTVVAIVNQKGGVAKTTTTQCLATALSELGFRVLTIDFDPQGSLSKISDAQSCQAYICDVLNTAQNPPLSLADIIRETKHYDICPSSTALSNIELQCGNNLSGLLLLKNAIANAGSAVEKYNFILVDCSPSVGVLIYNALFASDYVLIPAKSDTLSKDGVEGMLKVIEEVQTFRSQGLKTLGVLLTEYEANTLNAQAIRAEIESLLATKSGNKPISLFATNIRKCVAVRTSQSEMKNVFDLYPKSNIVADYRDFAAEFCTRVIDDRRGRRQ